MIGMIGCGKCGNVWGLFLAYFIVHILYTEIPFFIHSKNRASCLLNKRGVGSFKRICPHPVDNCCVKKKSAGNSLDKSARNCGYRWEKGRGLWIVRSGFVAYSVPRNPPGFPRLLHGL